MQYQWRKNTIWEPSHATTVIYCTKYEYFLILKKKEKLYTWNEIGFLF